MKAVGGVQHTRSALVPVPPGYHEGAVRSSNVLPGVPDLEVKEDQVYTKFDEFEVDM